MKIDEALGELVRGHPECKETAAFVAALYGEVGHVRLDPFLESTSTMWLKKDGKELHELIEVRAQDLNCWTRHISSSTMCRMRALEEPINEGLVVGKTLATMVLLRSHFEAAAMAAYCLDRLTDAARTEQPDALNRLIPSTLFGTGLNKHRDKTSVADLVMMSEGDAIRICHAVDSLDRFYFQEASEGKLAVVYSLLCDYAHPNHRGVLDFIHSTECNDGWLISYTREEPQNPQMRVHALETLLVSMRGGYAAAEMLRCWRFSPKEGGAIEWHSPSVDDGDRVWERFLQRPVGGGTR
jgi:hypothetical protein